MANNPFVPQTGTSTSSSGSRWITNPKHMPLFLTSGGSALIVKSTAVATVGSATAGFYTTQIANRGASSAITVANTLVTVCNLSGAGFLFNCVLPTHSSAFTPTLVITVDGVPYTFAPTTSITAAYRMVFGPLTQGASISSAAAIGTDVIAPNSATDNGFAAAMVGGIASNGTASACIPTPESILAYGMPCLRFESSLKVEMKCDLLSANAVDKQCGATYRLDV